LVKKHYGKKRGVRGGIIPIGVKDLAAEPRVGLKNDEREKRRGEMINFDEEGCWKQ